MKIYTILKQVSGEIENYGNLTKLVNDSKGFLDYHKVYRSIRRKGYYSDNFCTIHLKELRRSGRGEG